MFLRAAAAQHISVVTRRSFIDISIFGVYGHPRRWPRERRRAAG